MERLSTWTNFTRWMEGGRDVYMYTYPYHIVLIIVHTWTCRHPVTVWTYTACNGHIPPPSLVNSAWNRCGGGVYFVCVMKYHSEFCFAKRYDFGCNLCFAP